MISVSPNFINFAHPFMIIFRRKQIIEIGSFIHLVFVFTSLIELQHSKEWRKFQRECNTMFEGTELSGGVALTKEKGIQSYLLEF